MTFDNAHNKDIAEKQALIMLMAPLICKEIIMWIFRRT